MRIIFGVMEWGLGHSTRDIPLIEGLLSKGHSIDVLSHGRALKILQEKFGSRCNYFDVPSFFIPKNSRYFFQSSRFNIA